MTRETSCWLDAKGKCNKGDKCPYKHAAPAVSSGEGSSNSDGESKGKGRKKGSAAKGSGDMAKGKDKNAAVIFPRRSWFYI